MSSALTRPSQRWLFNIGSGYADSLVGGLIFLLLTPVLVRGVGAEGYALWVLGHTIAFYLGFLDLGFGNAQVRYHARFAAKDRPDRVRTVVATSAASLLISGFVAVLLGSALAFVPAHAWLDVSGVRPDEFRAVMFLLAVNMLVSFGGAAVENIYEGASRFDLRNVRSIAMRILTALALVHTVLRGGSVVDLIAIELAASSLRLAADLVITARLLPDWWRSSPEFRGPTWRRIRGFALWTSLDEVLTEGGAQLDHVLIALLFPLALLTPYALCTGIAAVLFLAVEPMVETFFPMASGMHASRRKADLARLLLSGSKVATAIAAPLAIYLIVFGDQLLELWVPEVAAELPTGLMTLIVLDYTTSVYLWTSTVVLVAMGRTRLAVALTVSEIALGIALVLALAPTFGLPGLAFASLAANVLLGYVLQIPLTARHVGVAIGELVGSTLGRVILACVPAVAAAGGIRLISSEPAWPMLVAAVVVTGAVYCAGMWLVGMSREERAVFAEVWRDVYHGMREKLT